MPPRSAVLNIVKKIVVKLFKLAYISDSFSYGRSTIFDYSLASFPEKSVIAGKPAFKLPVIDNSRIKGILREELVLSDRKYMIYVSNASVEAYECQLIDEIRCLEQLRKKLIEYRLLIKTHPIENPYKFNGLKGAEIIDDPFLPVEAMYSRNSIVLSTYSSALINAKLAGICAVSMSKLIKTENKEADSIMNSLGIFCPTHWSELVKYVREFVVNNELTIDNQNNEFVSVLKNASNYE